MPRIRSIKPDYFHDPELADCSLRARLAFIGLWCYADREGRLKDEPRKLKGVLFPYERVDFESVLQELVAGRFIIRYAVNGTSYLQVRTWAKHQQPHVKEQASTIPAPDMPGVHTVLAPRVLGTGSLVLDQVRTPATEPAGTRVREQFEARFLRFWAAYPRRQAKGDAWKAWKALKPSDELTHLICLAVERQRDWPQWTKDGGQFIPHAATWLRRKGWEDEAPPDAQRHGRSARPQPGGGTSCPHNPQCQSVTKCVEKTLADARTT